MWQKGWENHTKVLEGTKLHVLSRLLKVYIVWSEALLPEHAG